MKLEKKTLQNLLFGAISDSQTPWPILKNEPILKLCTVAVHVDMV